MKPQKYDRNKISILLALSCNVLIILLLCSCENDIQRINTITSTEILPDATGEKYEIIYSDSALIRVRVLADEIRQFKSHEKPYFEFPKGMIATFYDDSMEVESTMRANYVIYYNEEHLWEAKNDVEIKNLKTNEQLNTEHLYWDENKELVYSNTYSRIVNDDGTFYGQKGFEANQSFSWWKLKGTKGTVNVKDE